MNPFLFKAHPLMQATIGVLAGIGHYGSDDVARLLIIFLAVNLLYGSLFSLVVRRAARVVLRYHTAYLLAFPATLVYTPIVLTLLDDVLNHAFRLQDRYLLLFALGVAAVMLAAFYGVVVRFRGRPVGAEIGLTLAMALLLAAVPCSMLLLGLENWVSVFPPPGGLE